MEDLNEPEEFMSNEKNNTDPVRALIAELRDGCVYHRKRWSGDTHADLGTYIDEGATDALMAKAADELESALASAPQQPVCFLHPDDADMLREQRKRLRQVATYWEKPGNDAVPVYLGTAPAIDLGQFREVVEMALEVPIKDRSQRQQLEKLLALIDASPKYALPALPDDFSESKDWRAGNYADRIQWLMVMVRSQREHIDALAQQPAAPSAGQATGITAAELGYALKRAIPAQVIEYLEDDANMRAALSIHFEEQRDQQPAAPSGEAVDELKVWGTQRPGRMPKLFGLRTFAELNWYPDEGYDLVCLQVVTRITPVDHGAGVE